MAHLSLKILPFFLAESFHFTQLRWGLFLLSHFQAFPQMLFWVQVLTLAGPLQDFLRVFLKPFRCFLGSIFVFIFPSTMTSLPVPTAAKHPHSMALSPPCLTVGMVFIWSCSVSAFLHTRCWKPCPNSQIFVLSDQKSLLIIVWESITNCQVGGHVQNDSVWPLHQKGLMFGSQICTKDLWMLHRDHWDLDYLPDWTLCEQQDLGRLVVAKNLFHMRMTVCFVFGNL